MIAAANHDATDHQFELRVVPRGEKAYGLALYESRVRPRDDNGDGHTKVVQVWGDPLRAVIDQVLAAIKHAGYRPSDLSRSRRAPFQLREEDGVRLGVLFLAVKPLRKISRITTISQELGGMESEELLYWYSKSTSARTALHAQRALRILVAGG
jgi:hypothetical protein